MSDFFQEGDDRLQSPLAGKPSVVRSVSFSSDECAFLTPGAQAVLRGAPSGYSSAQIAQLARDLLAAGEGSAAYEALVAQVEADRATENAVTGIAPPSTSPSDHRIGF